MSAISLQRFQREALLASKGRSCVAAGSSSGLALCGIGCRLAVIPRLPSSLVSPAGEGLEGAWQLPEAKLAQ